VESETPSCDGENAGEGRHDRGQAGDELRGEHASCAVPGEGALGPAQPRVGLEGQLAEPHLHSRPAATAELIPDEVDGQGRDGDRPEDEWDTAAAVRGQGPDREESRHGGEWKPDLFGDGQGRQDHDAVTVEKLQAVRWAHSSSLSDARPPVAMATA